MILFYLFVLTGESIVWIYGRSGDHFADWSVLLAGSFSVNFYLFQMIIGAMVPIYLLLTKHSSRKIIFAAICTLIGVFAMRYNIIIGGQVVQPSGGPLGQYIPNLDEWIVSIGLWAVSGLLFTIAIQKLPLKPAIENNLEGRFK